MSFATTFKPTLQQRRFDSIAWLIHGDDTCGAAAFDGKQLLLATNKQNESELVKLIRQHLVTVVKSSMEYYELAKGKKLVAETLSVQYEKLKAEHYEKIETIKASLPFLTEFYSATDLIKYFVRSLKKITKSIRHTCLKEYCSQCHDLLPQELIDAIQQERINFIKYTTQLKCNLHAELNVINFLYKEKVLFGSNQEHYIGISRRCCKTCENIIKAINAAYGNKNDSNVLEIVHVRDMGHKNSYPAFIPDFLKKNPNIQDEFLKLYGFSPSNMSKENKRGYIKDIFNQPEHYAIHPNDNNMNQFHEMSDSASDTDSIESIFHH